MTSPTLSLASKALFWALGTLLPLSHAIGQEAAPAEQPAPPSPNVIVIYVDDLGAGEVGCYGQTKIQTPNIDAIAAVGMRFTQGYSGSPVCAPSRCSLMTGKHSGHAEVRDNWENGGWGENQPEGQWPLSQDEVTLAERLKARGYSTAGYGKWGLGGPGTRGAPERQGFGHFYGYLCQRKAHNYYPTHLWKDGVKAPIEGAEFFPAHQKLDAPLGSIDEYYERYGDGHERYAPALIAEDMLAWTRAKAEAGEPFFLYYASVIPHLALQVPREYVERYPAEWDTAPYLGKPSYLPHPSPRRAYAGMISFLDDQVGRLLDLIEDTGQRENTIVIFTSDNGATYTGGVDFEFFGSHDGRRGQKGSLYEGGVRIPFLASWPGHIAEGAVSDRLVSSIDLTATLLDLIGAEVPVGLDSVSFAPVLLGDDEAKERPFLYWEFRPAGAQALREGPWKLLRVGLKKGEPRLELYQMEKDPKETTNVIDKHPEIAARMVRLMDMSHEPSRGFPLPTIDGPAAEIMKRKKIDPLEGPNG
ncbi:Arylsulfatase precursor [Planctomycetes bacterium Poly30]|uniref:Arylsulfatase n=2 Tax=Saltatorellus ferox TaxID=2528018 RepID=A0A518EUE1_9BACT|nr:Arylsulfatase precursor [Planctomycetes bacterium Poly30]